MTPNFYFISETSKSLSVHGRSLKKIYRVENFRANVLKTGVHLKTAFLLGIMVLTQISRSQFKQTKISLLIPLIYVLGFFVKFLVIFRYIFLKGLVKFMKIGNFEDVILFYNRI